MSSAPPKVFTPLFAVSVNDDYIKPEGPDRENSADGKPLPKSISKSTRPVEIDMPANFPEVIAHDTESTYRESIIRYGLRPGGFGRRTRNENHFYETPTHLFEGRRGRSAE